MEREPLGQALNSIIRDLSATAKLLSAPETYPEVAAEEGNLRYIMLQIQSICSYIKTFEDAKSNNLRLVK